MSVARVTAERDTSMTVPLAAIIPDFINQNMGWWLFGIIVLLGVAIGARDLMRFSLRRIRAMHRELAAKLDTPGLVQVSSRATMEYYRDAGLLGAKKQQTANDLQVFSRLPFETGTRRYMAGSGEGQFLAPFDIDPEELRPSPHQEPGNQGVIIAAHVGYMRKNAATTETSTSP